MKFYSLLILVSIFLTPTSYASTTRILHAQTILNGSVGVLPIPATAPVAGTFLMTDGTNTSWGTQSMTITGTRGAPISITAAGGVTTVNAVAEQLQFVAGTAGATTVTANPQLTAGTVIGQKIHLKGTSDTNTLTFSDGTGLELNGLAVLKNKSILNLIWDGTIWGEESRNDI